MHIPPPVVQCSTKGNIDFSWRQRAFALIGILILNSVHSFLCVYFYAFVSQHLLYFSFFRCGREPECCSQGSRSEESAGQTVVSARSRTSTRSIGAASSLVRSSKRCPLSSLPLRQFATGPSPPSLRTYLCKPPPAMDRLCPGEGVSRTQASAGKL